jgi:hypothetical protein
MKKTTAEIPPSIAAEYAKTPDAAAAAEADGYVKPPTRKIPLPGKRKTQYGLPKSVKVLKIKG